MANETLRQQYLRENDGYADQAAISLAQDLMRGDTERFKQGYTRANAIYAAQAIFPEAAVLDWEKDV